MTATIRAAATPDSSAMLRRLAHEVPALLLAMRSAVQQGNQAQSLSAFTLSREK